MSLLGRRGGRQGGFIPGAKLSPRVTQEVGPGGALGKESIFIGNLDGEGAFGRSSMLGGFNTERGMSMGRSPMVQDLPGRRIDTSHVTGRSGVTFEDVMAARRAKGMNLGGSFDPGLSNRGVSAAGRKRPMPGPRGGAARGLEGRGTSAAGRTRPMPGPRGGTARGLEGRGVKPAPGTRLRPPPKGRVTKFAGSQHGRGVGQFPVPGHGGFKGMAAPATSGMNAPVIPAMKTDPNLIRHLSGLEGGYAGVVGKSVRESQPGRIVANVDRSAAGRSGGFRRSGVGVAGRSGSGTAGAVSTAADVAEGAIRGPGRAGAEAIQRAGTTSAKRPLTSMMKNKKGLLIGAGAAVVAGLAYSGRRGDGSSGGRTSQYRY